MSQRPGEVWLANLGLAAKTRPCCDCPALRSRFTALPSCFNPLTTQNRLLYISDVTLDQVFVFDADTLKLKRKIGTTGHNHELTAPGDLAKPTGVAVDKEGNLYVADTLNDRIEVFDADGVFLRTWGKNGDGPGYFARPKSVAVDSDGHVWVADGMQDRVQVFTNEGQL